jgi:hypothetical protein
MYSIKAVYCKKAAAKSINSEFNTDYYEEAMRMFEKLLLKKGIRQKDIISYSVTKSILCARCKSVVRLNGTRNECKCGAVYGSFGNAIQALYTASQS